MRNGNIFGENIAPLPALPNPFQSLRIPQLSHLPQCYCSLSSWPGRSMLIHLRKFPCNPLLCYKLPIVGWDCTVTYICVIVYTGEPNETVTILKIRSLNMTYSVPTFDYHCNMPNKFFYIFMKSLQGHRIELALFWRLVIQKREMSG
jgi:hypothetical protein